MILDGQQGLALVSRKFGFKVQCFLGPTGALRIPIQQFSREMIQSLSQQVSSDSREYELLRTEHCSTTLSDDPRVSASIERSQPFDKSPFPGATPRDIVSSNVGRTFQARPNRVKPVCDSGPTSLGSDGTTLAVDHCKGNWASSDHVPEHGGTARSSGSSDDRVSRITGRQTTGCGGGSSRPTSSRAISAGVEAKDSIAHTFELVQGDVSGHVSTFGSSTSDSEVQDTNFDAGNSGLSHGIHVGRACGDQPSEGLSEVLLSQERSAVCVQDREEPKSAVLEMPELQTPPMQLLSLAGSGDPSSGTSTTRYSSFDRGMADEASARSLPAHPHDESRVQCLLPSDSVHGLWPTTGEGGHGLSATEGRVGEEVRDGQPARRSKDGGCQHGEGVRRVSGMAQPTGATTAGGKGGSRGGYIIDKSKDEPSKPVLVDEVRAGLRRHIYGCLKRSEQCWLEIFQLLCSTPDDEQSKHLETTCAIIRKSLQLQQPHMKQLSEIYALQPKQLKTIAEICNPNRFGKHADVFGLRSGQAFDLELGWNLLDRKQQSYVQSYISTEKPGLVVLSPPCTKFSMLQNLSYPKWCNDSVKFEQHLRELRQAKELLRFCAEICELCRQLGIIFIFEHPWSASSWNERCLQKVMSHDDVHLARTDQCEFGLETEQGEPMRKRSGFLTNSYDIAEALNKTCQKSHQHCHVMGRAVGSQWNRSRLAQKYPYALVAAILTAYVQTVGLSKLRPLYFVDAYEVLQNDIKMDQRWLLAGEDLTSIISGCQDIYALRFGEEEGEPSEPGNQYKERSFPGTHPLSLEALVRRAHEGLGHPGRDRFLRILTNSKASKKVLEIAKNLQCSVCEKFKAAKAVSSRSPAKGDWTERSDRRGHHSTTCTVFQEDQVLPEHRGLQ